MPLLAYSILRVGGRGAWRGGREAASHAFPKSDTASSPIYALAFALPAMEEGVPPQRELMLLVQANDCVQFNKKISLRAASLQVSVCEALAHA